MEKTFLCARGPGALAAAPPRNYIFIAESRRSGGTQETAALHPGCARRLKRPTKVPDKVPDKLSRKLI